jgi:hypothetical protein
VSLTWVQDRLYWRPTPSGRWHCFGVASCTRGGRVTLTSLCSVATRTRTGGATISRPPSWMRCAICDGAEATRRGVDECFDESPGWEKQR